jgi:hypothetical protein
MVVFDAAPFYGGPGDDGHIKAPLRFRGISDSLAKYHLEASECCLIHFDNPLTRKLFIGDLQISESCNLSKQHHLRNKLSEGP